MVLVLTVSMLLRTCPAYGAGLIPGLYGSTSSDVTAPLVSRLPALRNFVKGISSLENQSDNRLVIHQDEGSAIIDWESFDIGADASVHFDQQGNKAWKALNRIYSLNPSLIYGNLTADGNVYLINQNGILFSESSRINVGSLIASSLNIADEDFLGGTLTFRKENYINPGNPLSGTGTVSNYGTITVDDAGSVFLLGAYVENNGEISAYLGWAALAAGEEISLYQEENNDEISNIVSVKNGRNVYNYQNGSITADMGQAGMYGSIVNQDGMIRSVTAVRANGRIELLASESVVLGENSITSSPISDSSEEVHESFPFSGGEILIDGLDDDHPLGLLEHYGSIEAPAGDVEINVSDRIYLGKDSSIDVGGLWIERPVSEKTVEVQLNSVELRDNYGQKNGILSGESINVSALTGSSIGDIGNYLSAEEKTAKEMALEGGSISLDAGSGDIILREDALLDVSGGGISYTEGAVDTTKLVSVNNVVYDISDAPEWENYSKILGEYKKIHERYGVTETYRGIYYGGAAALRNYTSGYTEGSDAGFISLIGSKMILDGFIDGSVSPGKYQTLYPSLEDEALYDAMGLSLPDPGTLEIGDTSIPVYYWRGDPVVEEIVVLSSVDVLPDDFTAGDPFPEARNGKTYIPSGIINNSGMGTLRLYSRTGLTVSSDAEIFLPSDGYLEAKARSITIEGEISVPGGSIDLILESNITTDSIISSQDNPEYVSQDELGHERIFLSSGSSLSVAGEVIDNSLYDSGSNRDYDTGITEGGIISISDRTLYGEGVVVQSGASIDVSGGYEIDDSGNVSGGDAGSLDIQGITVILDGDIMGYSVPGRKGGSIKVHAGTVSVLPDYNSAGDIITDFTSDIPDELLESFIIDDDFFNNTGFTDINLTALDRVDIASGSVLSPSYMKYYVSAGGLRPGDYGTESSGTYALKKDHTLVNVTGEYLGDSSVTLNAGKDLEGEVISGINEISGIVKIESGAEIHSGPGGEISLDGIYIESGGDLYAPGGDIGMDALGITLNAGSLVSAKGYTFQSADTLVDDLPAGYLAVDGGTVSLNASYSDIKIESGVVLDVSGSEAVNKYTWDNEGNVTAINIAGSPGSVSFSFVGDLEMDGELKADTHLKGLKGGSLSISRMNADNSLEIDSEDISSYVSMGFDSIDISSQKEIVLSGSRHIDIGRNLIMDAPLISAADGSNISIRSPWITLANTYNYSEDAYAGETGNSILKLTADCIDLSGYVTLSSFKEVEIVSGYDIRLKDHYYNRSSNNITRLGGLDQTGDLVMQADRIYPETLASFKIHADGDFTVLDNGDNLSDTVYSAGASLEIEADNIYLYGDIYAPLGEISLSADAGNGTVYLAEGSTLSAHSDAAVKYGLMDSEGIFWGLPLESGAIDDDSPVESAPTGSVIVEANEVVMADGSEIDVSGGGNVFAYKFLSGTAGSEDPLKKKNQYIILSDNSVYSPGETVSIGENSEIPAGEYYLLDEEYAFAEGAIVLTDLGTDLNPSEYRVTEEGYSVISGKKSVAGTGLESKETHYYSMRSAEDLLSEGYFEIKDLEAGKGGSVSLKGSTTIVEGNIHGEPLNDSYSGGTLELSGKNVILTAGSENRAYSLPDSYNPYKKLMGQISGELIDKLVLSDDSISGQGMEKIILGDEETTLALTVEEGVDLELKSIELNAGNTITLKDNSKISAISDNGEGIITFNTLEGNIEIAETAVVHASDTISLDARGFDIQGSLLVDNSSINLTSEKIYFVPDNYSGMTDDAAYITESLWSILSQSENIELGSGSEIIFEESFDLGVSSEIILNASVIESRDADITISSKSVTLLNSGDRADSVTGSGTGSLVIDADEITLSEGIFVFEGFSEISLVSSGDITVQGTGGLVTGNADLEMNGAGVVSSALVSNDVYDVMDYSIDAGTGSVSILSNGAGYGDSTVSGGSFEVTAMNVNHSGILNMPGTDITLHALGSEPGAGVVLSGGALINASGGDHTSGGKVRLATKNGMINLETGSEINVSAGGQGDAGEIEMISPSGTLVINGDINGNANGGKSGSFTLDSLNIDQLGDLIEVLDAGGFHGSVDLRARSGNIILSEQDELTAGQITISADGEDGNGDIDLYGSLILSGDNDSTDLDVFAAGSLTLHSESLIDSPVSKADITLSGSDKVVFEAGAVIDAGSDENPGSVLFRSERTAGGANMELYGTVSNAESITAEAVKIYDDSSHDGIIDTEIAQWQAETDAFMSDAQVMKDALFNNLNSAEGVSLYFAPGIEVKSGNDLIINKTWDLTDRRYDVDGDGSSETSGSLLLRSAGNLIINRDIKDAPTDKYSLYENSLDKGWNIGLHGGADLSAANPMDTSTLPDSGDIVIGEGVRVYTERGDISFSSGRDTVINTVNVNTTVTPSSMGHNLATYTGSIYGEVGGSLVIDGGAIQSSGGDIDIKVGENILMTRNDGYMGTIRSLGTSPDESLRYYWEYEQGGSISLDVGGSIQALPSTNDAWDAMYWGNWSASFEGSYGQDVAQGIVAMSGGDISIKAGNDVFAGIGIFGEGDLDVYSGSDISGRFLVKDGTASLYAAGNFGKSENLDSPQIELFDAQLYLTAGGSIKIGAIVNPTLASDDFTSDSSWNLSYTVGTAVSLNALSLDVELTGDTPFYGIINQKLKQKILPANLSISAGRDIFFRDSFVMAPSADGQLVLEAGRDINGEYLSSGGQTKRAGLYMSDLSPADVLGKKTLTTSRVEALLNSLTQYQHGTGVLHKNDDNMISIKAKGDIRNIALYLPKAAEISAGKDIRDIYYNGQNTDSSDISIIWAGDDISFSSDISGQYLYTGIVQGGPGTLMVNAGAGIDLGTTDGIQLVGNQYNPYLKNDYNDLVVITGMEPDVSLDDLKTFFGEIREAGASYSSMLAQGNISEAEEIVEKLRVESINPLLEGSLTGKGNIDMVESQINVTGGPGGVYLLATGEINVGKTTFTESGNVNSDSGIYTTAGGSVNIFSLGDLNVNESRVMTFAGGDITVWSDQGNINAGRGSKTSVNATESEAVFDEGTGTWSIVFEAPAVGSGIRTLTFDPDGIEGPKEEPLAGDIFLFAPEGEIDAGEAGISGTNVTLGATEILNAQNITFSQGSVGVPVAAASISMGALAGMNNLTETGSITDKAATAVSDAREQAMKEAMEAMEDLIARWLNVEVIGFYEDE